MAAGRFSSLARGRRPWSFVLSSSTCFATESLAPGPVTVAVRVPDVLRGCHQYLAWRYRFIRFLSLSSSSDSFPFSCSSSPSRPCSEDWSPCESGWLQVGSRAWRVVDALGRAFFVVSSMMELRHRTVSTTATTVVDHHPVIVRMCV